MYPGSFVLVTLVPLLTLSAIPWPCGQAMSCSSRLGGQKVALLCFVGFLVPLLS